MRHFNFEIIKHISHFPKKITDVQFFSVEYIVTALD